MSHHGQNSLPTAFGVLSVSFDVLVEEEVGAVPVAVGVERTGRMLGVGVPMAPIIRLRDAKMANVKECRESIVRSLVHQK